MLEGIHVEPLMNDPFQSLSLREFWSDRWDRAVQMILKDLVYIPCRRRGLSRDTSGTCTFLASAVLHIYGVITGYGWDLQMCVSIFLFFALQPLALYLEAGLVPATNHKYLVYVLVAASPFFLEPVCNIIAGIEI